MNGILNGINKQNIILRNSLIIAILELIGLFIFTSIPSINIYGYTITLLLTSIISLIINIYEIKKTIDMEISITNIVIYCLLGILIYFILKIIVTRVIVEVTIFKSIILILFTFGIFSYLSTFGEEYN